MSTFHTYAKYYDQFYDDKDYQAESDYAQMLLKKYKADARSILELGCGTGKHALALANRGYSVHGIDISEEMITKARQRMQQQSGGVSDQLQFEKADIRSYTTAQNFDAVISFFHVISYQTENEDILGTFHTARRHLDKDGLFIFDCWYGPAVLTDKPVVRTREFKNKEYMITRVTTPTLHPNSNIADIHFDFSVTDTHGKPLEQFHELHRMRYLFKPEILMLLDSAQFQLLAHFKWLTVQDPDFDSWYTVFIAAAK